MPDTTAGAAATGALPADPRTALAWWALSYTPRVALLDEAVLMEVSSSERLWGGRKRLLELIFKQNRPDALVHGSRGATSLVAIGLSRLAASGAPRPERVPDQLPLSVLSAAQPHLATLARIGCRTWGDVRALPRSGVARRFGAELLDALDRAWGERPESHVWLTLPERFDAPYELPALTENAPALIFGAQRLLSQLRVWLQARQRGVIAFELTWLLDARRSEGVALPREQQLVVRTGQATQDVTHLSRLLSEQLARTSLPAPVHSLRLRSIETARLVPTSAMLLPEDRAMPASDGSLQQLIERLAARLGPDRVLHAVARADHRPEWMQHWEPTSSTIGLIAVQDRCTNGSGRKDTKNRPKNGVEGQNGRKTMPIVENSAENGMTSRIQNGALLPTWLLREPLPLAQQDERPQFHGPLQLLAGPHRLESGWWADDGAPNSASSSDPEPALRDYFIAQGDQAGLLWIYRERLSGGETASAGGGRWFLHGLYA